MSLERLATEMRLRRKHLGLTQPQAAKRGGKLGRTNYILIENNRLEHLSPRLREGIEQALDWEPGSVDLILAGADPVPLGSRPVPPASLSLPGGQSPAATAERFEKARWILKMRRSFSEHQQGMDAAARDALDKEFTSAARDIENALVLMLPWLGDDERGEAIKILVELRNE